MKRILLIAGGWSSERDVSLASGKNIQQALELLGHHVVWYDPEHSFDDLPGVIKDIDFAFIGLHGSPGEDGLVQSLLEKLGVPYQGSDAAGSLIAFDKAASKVLFKKAHLTVASSVLLSKQPEKGWCPPFSAPYFIKDNTNGSSLNMTYVPEEKHLDTILEDLFSKGNSFLVEQAIHGVEVTCGVLAERENGREVPKALPPILIKSNSASGLFDYESKYALSGADEICPAPLPKEIIETVQQMSITAHNVLGLCSYSRSDFIIQESGIPVILETNTLPGLTSASLFPKEVAVIGLGYGGLLERLIELGIARKRQDSL